MVTLGANPHLCYRILADSYHFISLMLIIIPYSSAVSFRASNRLWNPALLFTTNVVSCWSSANLTAFTKWPSTFTPPSMFSSASSYLPCKKKILFLHNRSFSDIVLFPQFYSEEEVGLHVTTSALPSILHCIPLRASIPDNSLNVTVSPLWNPCILFSSVVTMPGDS